jgi:hypothetical protein
VDGVCGERMSDRSANPDPATPAQTGRCQVRLLRTLRLSVRRRGGAGINLTRTVAPSLRFPFENTFVSSLRRTRAG